MLLDLSRNRVELSLHTATSLFQITFPLRVVRLYLQNGRGLKQRLSTQEWVEGSGWSYQVNRPQSVIRDVTCLVAKGEEGREQTWDARFLGGIVAIRVSHTSSYGDNTHMWIGLWENMVEDPNQLQFRFDPEGPTRFDFIG
jgi:hypothetical protein